MVAKYFILLFLAAFKFLFAPTFSQKALDHSFLTTFILVSIGGIIGTTFFYYFTEHVSKFIAQLTWVEAGIRKVKTLIGLNKPKRNITRLNRFIIKIKHTLGVFGIAVLGCLIISIPISAAIAGKFFKHDKKAIFIFYGVVILTSLFLTSITYLF